MSTLNITRNIFLEKEELRRLQQFLADDITQKLFVKNTVSFGLVLSDFVNPNPLDFQIQVGTNVGTIKLANDSFALDLDGLLVSMKAVDNLAVPSNGAWYWVRVSHQYDPTEAGTCSIDINGNLTGVNTLFQDVLRGQATEVPTKIKFRKADGSALVNSQAYELVDVTSNISASLTGGSFVAESNLQYIVVGATPISEFLTAEQLTGLYQYDSCNVELVAEEVLNTPPVINFIDDKTFYVARVQNISGTVSVQDKRSQWWSFNIPGIGDKMTKTSNLSDLTDLAAARSNLEVYSKTETDTLLVPINSHQQAVGRTLIIGSGSGNGVRTDMAGMSITYVPKGNNALIYFSAALHASVTAQGFDIHIVKDSVDLNSIHMSTYQQTFPVAVQWLTSVTKGTQTTIKIAWTANSNFDQNGVIAPRVLTIIDLP